jgi:hypothetical protein
MAADLSDNPPNSCAPGKAACFPGLRRPDHPAFEVGPNWSYSYSAAGPGNFGVGVISEEPVPSYLPEDLPPEMLPAGGMVRGEVVSGAPSGWS